jgi:4,5-DOPA dioxygenase extradiol
MSTLPAVFVSHGSPMLLLDGGRTLDAWRALAADLPRPRAVLAVSAHWTTAAPAVGSVTAPPTIHDFGGFPQPLYEIQYPAPGAPELAGRVASLLGAAGLPTALDPVRGLDHGAWVPMSVMYPGADVAVTQLSVQPRADPAHHVRLGRALAPLRDEGVLILASGSLTHNLHDMVWGAGDDASAVKPYVREFQQWIFEKMQAGDTAALCEYRRQAPHAVRAHPTDEHLLPLFVAYGAAGEAVKLERWFDGVTEGVLAMDAYAFGSALPLAG